MTAHVFAYRGHWKGGNRTVFRCGECKAQLAYPVHSGPYTDSCVLLPGYQLVDETLNLWDQSARGKVSIRMGHSPHYRRRRSNDLENNTHIGRVLGEIPALVRCGICETLNVLDTNHLSDSPRRLMPYRIRTVDGEHFVGHPVIANVKLRHADW